MSDERDEPRRDEAPEGGGEGRTTSCLLEVIEGPQRGSRERLEIGPGGCTLGSGFGCDVVLLDPRIGERALAVGVDGEGALALEVLDGELERDGVALEGRGPHRHVDGAVCRLGSSAFTLAIATRAGVPIASPEVEDGTSVEADPKGVAPTRPEPPGIGTVRRALGVGSAATPHDGDDPEGAGALAVEDPNVWAPRFLAGAAVILCAALGVSYALHRPSAPAPTPPALSAASAEQARRASPTSAPSDLPRRLAGAGFEKIALVEGEGATGAPVRLSGYVDSRRRLNELQRLARDAHPRPELDVYVQRDILEGVRDVYRTNGVEAAVESLGPGEVRVITAELEPRDPAFMRAAAMEDVAGLVRLEVRNDPPPVAPPEPPEPERPPSVEEVPGKRVVAVVNGSPSYVVTEDDSRYFVGSLLPTGHTIAAIAEEGVTLEWRGQRTELRF